ncbi:MAG TPA: hypothetical protein IAC20_05095 [Candidatus Faecisoma merdavium]|mgnify:CR=1 FL=1|nr:hypothetical protein [Candidatus Faecisoma merdavium]
MKKYVLLLIYVMIFPLVLYLVFYKILNNLGILLLYYFLIIVNTLTVIKIVLNYIRYGEKMNPFKKVAKPTYNEMIISELSKLNSYQKSLIIDNNLIVINEAGIFEFVRINKSGTIKGNIKDDYWYINDKQIKNPFILRKDTFNYVILNGHLIFNVTGVWLTTRKLLYNTVDKRLNKRVYNKEQIDKIYNDLSNNVKL